MTSWDVQLHRDHRFLYWAITQYQRRSVVEVAVKAALRAYYKVTPRRERRGCPYATSSTTCSQATLDSTELSVVNVLSQLMHCGPSLGKHRGEKYTGCIAAALGEGDKLPHYRNSCLREDWDQHC